MKCNKGNWELRSGQLRCLGKERTENLSNSNLREKKYFRAITRFVNIL